MIYQLWLATEKYEGEEKTENSTCFNLQLSVTEQLDLIRTPTVHLEAIGFGTAAKTRIAFQRACVRTVNAYPSST